MTGKIVLLSDTQAIVTFDGAVSDRLAAEVAAQVKAIMAEPDFVMVLNDSFEVEDRRPIAVQSDLARLEAKIDQLTAFSGWRTGDGMPLTVAEKAEIDRLDDELDLRETGG